MSKQTIITLTVLIAATLIIGGAVVLKNEDRLAGSDDMPKRSTTSTTENTTAVSVPATSNTATVSSSSSPYKNGTYSATGSYSAPDGRQEIGVTLVIDSGIVADTSAQNKATGRESAQYVDQFIADYKGAVVGKKLQDLKGLVSGDSLTLAGFEDAVTQIQNQAKV